MQKKQYVPLALIAVAILSGCSSSSPPQNAALTAAHGSYSSARSNPDITSLAALELKEAGDTLSKADDAFSKGQGTDTVNHLSYLANQQVGIAQETAKRKTAELAVANASAKRTEVRLEARTAEADAAKRQAAIAQKTADLQAADLAAADAELAAADANAQRDRASLEARTAEADAAKQQAEIAQQNADQQAAALADARANAERDQALIAQQEMQLKELNARKTERGLVITLGDVLFNTNKAQLKSGGIRNVQKLADFLKQYPKHVVLVEGHTDSTGSDSFNQELSDRRANAVRTALIDKGIGGDRVTTRGYGEAYPIAGNDTSAGRQLNRRVEIILSDSNGNIAPR
ncbi:MAG: OmpA family protein [Gallionella sp.]|nr:OmpA family protein [Gallionella sp.]